MTTKQETEQANIFMWKWLKLIFVITLIGTALLIWYGTQPETELWASYATRAAGPSIEIIP